MTTRLLLMLDGVFFAGTGSFRSRRSASGAPTFCCCSRPRPSPSRTPTQCSAHGSPSIPRAAHFKRSQWRHTGRKDCSGTLGRGGALRTVRATRYPSPRDARATTARAVRAPHTLTYPRGRHPTVGLPLPRPPPDRPPTRRPRTRVPTRRGRVRTAFSPPAIGLSGLTSLTPFRACTPKWERSVTSKPRRRRKATR